MKISCAVSPCPNDVFIFSGLITGEVAVPGLEWEFRFEDIETLNRLALAGAPGLIKVSAALVGKLPGYQVLSSGGAIGRGCGPLLLGHRPALDERRPLLLPGRHTTARFLCHFYLKEQHPYWKLIEKKFMPFDALYRELVDHPDSQGVVIHESRFTYERDGLTCIRDLGAYWEGATGYPIPLGVIVAGSAAGGIETNPGQLSDAVRRSLEWAYQHEEEAMNLCREYAQEMEDSVMRAHVDLYVNDYSLNMGEAGRRALDFLLSQQLE